MLRRLIPLSFLPLLLFLAACSHLPSLRPLGRGDDPAAIKAGCLAAFSPEARRLVHRVQADLPLGGHSAMLGVSQVEPARGRIRAVLLSVEGLTLLDAERGPEGDLIHRALGPMADPDFAAGLLDDVSLLLLEPDGRLELGQTEERLICRFRGAAGTVDIEFDGQTWKLERYSPEGRLQRQAELDGQRAHILAGGAAGYQLWLELERQEKLD